jgi:hypothetical protein
MGFDHAFGCFTAQRWSLPPFQLAIVQLLHVTDNNDLSIGQWQKISQYLLAPRAKTDQANIDPFAGGRSVASDG